MFVTCHQDAMTLLGIYLIFQWEHHGGRTSAVSMCLSRCSAETTYVIFSTRCCSRLQFLQLRRQEWLVVSAACCLDIEQLQLSAQMSNVPGRSPAPGAGRHWQSSGVYLVRMALRSFCCQIRIQLSPGNCCRPMLVWYTTCGASLLMAVAVTVCAGLGTSQ